MCPLRWISTVVLFSVAPPTKAQLAFDKLPHSLGPAHRIGTGVGVREKDDGIWAVGTDYRARFAKAGIMFQPALGSLAPTGLTLNFELLTVGRGTTRVAAGASQPELGNREVLYRRARCTEKYELSEEGIKQSFVFEQLPPGEGDLVVRGRLVTKLPQVNIERRDIQRTAARELVFCEPGLGGVRIRDVVGIDADGRRVAGSMQCKGGFLELRLPGDFVQSATLPLIVDPTIGAIIEVSDDSLNYFDPDIAYDVSRGMYLVCWQRSDSVGDQDVVAQRIDSRGLAGDLILIDTAQFNDSRGPRVAAIEDEDTFIVVWRRGNDIVSKGIGTDGLVSLDHTVTSSSNPKGSLDIAGRPHGTICVWGEPVDNRVMITGIAMNAGDPRPGSLNPQRLASGLEPAIPKRIGGDEYFVVVLNEGGVIKAVHADGIPASSSPALHAERISSLANNNNSAPRIDGFGNRWVAVWRNLPPRATNRHVHSRSLFTAGFGLQVGAFVSHGSGEIPEVTWFGESCAVTYQDSSNDKRHWLFSIDPHSCQSCVGTARLAVGHADNVKNPVRMAGDPETGKGMLTWQSRQQGTRATTHQILGSTYTAADGTVRDLGGGCGDSTAVAGCAMAGNVAFSTTLSGAPEGAPKWLVVALETANLPCGPCQFVPSPFTGWIQPAASSVFTVLIPPGTSGVTAYLQWAIASSTPSCSLGVDLSNAIRIDIQ